MSISPSTSDKPYLNFGLISLYDFLLLLPPRDLPRICGILSPQSPIVLARVSFFLYSLPSPGLSPPLWTPAASPGRQASPARSRTWPWSPWDHDAISLVGKKWYRIDTITHKHITIAFCYSASPDRLRQRFPRLESLKLKGKPRASMFNNIIPEDWGGYAAPWATEITDSLCLKAIHFRRMVVKDDDIGVLV
ncbi:uncharacterized protein A4U43_C01F19330 [Asparagus officinalis]|uniref:Transport inhibitor response 1 domain-containing protein n=1 Tax=Asparagus officinalis TaxID=4686 RepID=A0A5P1FSC6_ASPOF|nr:uncharacterized protein A4U43_C01F19330 [Asparagus officinalis]